MSILIVDDSAQQRKLLSHILEGGGFTEVVLAESGHQALEILGHELPKPGGGVDLILTDLLMPEMDGIEVCRRVRQTTAQRDIPIIVVTAVSDLEKLDSAFAAGAMDYVVKPVQRVELLARARSLLRLKQEVDTRKARELELMRVTAQLQEANGTLERLSMLDGLTGIANRRYFDQSLAREWTRGIRDAKPLSLLMIDIDHFKSYNDLFGHQLGDECLRAMAAALDSRLRRGADFVARYGGEEFAVVLPGTESAGARALAEELRSQAVELKIDHTEHRAARAVTISVGGATMMPAEGSSPAEVIRMADEALYMAKREGRNRVVWWQPRSDIAGAHSASGVSERPAGVE